MSAIIRASHNKNDPPRYLREPGWHTSTLTKLINHAHKTFDQPELMHAVHDAELARLITRYIDEKKQQKLIIPQEIISVQGYLAETLKTSSRGSKPNT